MPLARCRRQVLRQSLASSRSGLALVQAQAAADLGTDNRFFPGLVSQATVGLNGAAADLERQALLRADLFRAVGPDPHPLRGYCSRWNKAPPTLSKQFVRYAAYTFLLRAVRLRRTVRPNSSEEAEPGAQGHPRRLSGSSRPPPVVWRSAASPGIPIGRWAPSGRSCSTPGEYPPGRFCRYRRCSHTPTSPVGHRTVAKRLSHITQNGQSYLHFESQCGDRASLTHPRRTPTMFAAAGNSCHRVCPRAFPGECEPTSFAGERGRV